MKQPISTDRAPAAIGPYSQAISHGCYIFASGQLPITPSGEMPAGAAEQAEVCLDNLEAVLAAGGATLDDIVKVTIFLADMADFALVNDVYARRIRSPFPARSTFAVAALPKSALVEVEAIAIRAS